MEEQFTILAVDDNPVILHSLKRTLSRRPYRVITTDKPEDALGLIEQESIALVLLDLIMPGYDGMSILRDIVRLYPEVAVLMLTGCGDIKQAVEAIKIGADDFLEKPCPTDFLLQRITTYYSIWQQKKGRSDEVTAFTYSPLSGESPVMQKLKSLLVRVAHSDATILLQGESGTGKELAARAIHHHSVRKQHPFIAVDCAAISENVMESELFGHEKGAFTGADKSTTGLFRAAEKGTLFLDEIGELPMPMQSKLLRTLQEHEVRPVGGSTTYPLNIRILAATNRNLEREVAEGHFRSDLFYRLATIQIDLPPLRERDDDILRLAHCFITQYAKESPVNITPEAKRLLRQHSWPGNVRELENVIRRAIVMMEGKEICAEDLPATIVVNREAPPAHPPREDSLSAYERAAIKNALHKTGNNKRKAAALLEIGEATLYRKLKQFNLSM